MVKATIEILRARSWSSRRLLTLYAPLHSCPGTCPWDKGASFSSLWFQLQC